MGLASFFNGLNGVLKTGINVAQQVMQQQSNNTSEKPMSEYEYLEKYGWDKTSEDYQKYIEQWYRVTGNQKPDSENTNTVTPALTGNTGPVVNTGAPSAKNGIKIKKSNKGKFTKYCNGKVTKKCIDKAKRSGNKKLMKRAVFAENARKWKK